VRTLDERDPPGAGIVETATWYQVFGTNGSSVVIRSEWVPSPIQNSRWPSRSSPSAQPVAVDTSKVPMIDWRP
jgi:hypothetical protein